MNEDFLNDALEYAKAPAPDTTLVLHHGGGVRGKKLLDALKTAGAVLVDCQPLKKDAEKIDFVTQEFKAAKRRLSPEGARALVAALGSDLSELAAACSQLLQDTTGADRPGHGGQVLRRPGRGHGFQGCRCRHDGHAPTWHFPHFGTLSRREPIRCRSSQHWP